MANPAVFLPPQIKQIRFRPDTISQQRPTADVSEATYWATYYELSDVSYEWHNGVLEEKPMATYLQASLYSWFLAILNQYRTVHPIARITLLEMGFRLALAPNNVAIRKPDIGVVRDDNPVALADDDRSFHGVFDLCVEVLSDSDKAQITRDTVQKRREYERIGVREYFILDDKARHTQFLYRTNSGLYQPMTAQNGIISSTVLPGFQFRVNDLYRRPSLVELAQDPVYQTYILPELQEAEDRAAQAKLDLAQEKRHSQQLEQELARLRAELNRQ